MFARFREGLARAMVGRYGMDDLNRALCGLTLLLYIVNLFAHSLVLVLLELGAFWWMFFRVLSRNLWKRREENRKFMKLFGGVKKWFLLQKNKWKYRKTHVNRKCPGCKTVLRLPRRAGEHQVKCPTCGARFEVKV